VFSASVKETNELILRGLVLWSLLKDVIWSRQAQKINNRRLITGSETLRVSGWRLHRGAPADQWRSFATATTVCRNQVPNFVVAVQDWALLVVCAASWSLIIAVTLAFMRAGALMVIAVVRFLCGACRTFLAADRSHKVERGLARIQECGTGICNCGIYSPKYQVRSGYWAGSTPAKAVSLSLENTSSSYLVNRCFGQ
jgi:hypothetical protein